ncbi:hypothetical protein GQ42DRAFT_110201, partial [Ramicandelaber brevisporus]
KYKLTIVQQPNRARMCGFGEKDRRPIDPPPVIQLKIVNGKDGTEIEPPYITSLVVHASIWSTAGEDVGLVAQPTATPRPVEITHEEASSHQFHRNLIGYTISSAYRLKNHNDELGTFFVFPDISVRAEGAFKLKFVLVDIATGGGHSNVLAEVISSRFQVYSAKKFPGMTDSTLLSKKFASQGIKINIRK